LAEQVSLVVLLDNIAHTDLHSNHGRNHLVSGVPSGGNIPLRLQVLFVVYLTFLLQLITGGGAFVEELNLCLELFQWLGDRLQTLPDNEIENMRHTSQRGDVVPSLVQHIGCELARKYGIARIIADNAVDLVSDVIFIKDTEQDV